MIAARRSIVYDVDRQRADAPAVEEVGESVAEARDHHDHLALHCFVEELGLHAEAGRHGSEARAEAREGVTALGAEADAHEEVAGIRVVELTRRR
jgi:hypothetical protein